MEKTEEETFRVTSYQLMIQQGNHIKEHESNEEDDKHGVHDEPSLEAQVGNVVEVVEHPSLGPPIDEVQIHVEAASRAVALSNNSHQEKIEHFKADLMALK